MLEITTVFSFFMLLVTAEECSPYAKCLTCPAEIPYLCTSCEKGYYLARGGAYYNCQQCHDACVECEDSFTCTICKSGRYGSECQNVCGKGCVYTTCDQNLGHCDCKENYSGPKCDTCTNGRYSYEFNCQLECPVNCKMCISNTNCTLCNNGYYGPICENNCSKGCYSDVCSQSNGTCLGGKCKPNFDGLNCVKCAIGLYGNDCSSTCPKGCVSCQSDANCDSCEDGHWGLKCKHNCSHGCLEGLCAKETGICKQLKCMPGFVGDTCRNCIHGKRGFNCNINATAEKDYSSKALHFKMSALVIILPLLVNRISVAD